MESLAASLRIATDALREPLVSAPDVERLHRLAEDLPPLHCAGFEVRLADTSAPVDFIQRIRALDGEPELFARHLRQRAPASLAWQSVAGLCRAWRDPDSGLAEDVAGAFLAFDLDQSAAPEPSAYLSIAPRQRGGGDSFARFVAALAGHLDVGLSSRVLDTVARCHDLAPAGTAVTDVGFMLSRRIDALRLVFAPLEFADVNSFLAALPWGGDPPDIDAARLIPPDVYPIGVSLDVAAAVIPRVGLEYGAGHFADDLPTWRAALDALVDAGLCVANKREALLAWAGHFEPPAHAANWPASLLVDSLLNRSDQFHVLARRLNFLKLVCGAGIETEAKAYFGYGPRSFAPTPGGNDQCREFSLDIDRSGAGDSGSRRRNRSAASEGRDLDGAVEAAIAFLAREQTPAGWWLEFPRILGGTDEWATAYIASAIASVDKGSETARAAWEWLASVERDGWGYNSELPVDADSIFWGLNLAGALALDTTPLAQRAVQTLQRHIAHGGGVATYAPGAEPGLRSALGNCRINGLFAPHTCVSAAAAAVLERRHGTHDYVAARQQSDGRWRGYWWQDAEYPTALAVRALSHDEARLEQAGSWAAHRFDDDGGVWSVGLDAVSPFATALCLRILVETNPAGAAPVRERAIDWLLRNQRADGSWAASSLMRMPPPDTVDGDAKPRETTIALDDRGYFTTATVLEALNAARAAG